MANVHKDFHGALSYGIRFLTDRYGPDKLHAFLQGLGSTVYRPLAEAMRQHGLSPLREHLEQVFRSEDGDAESEMDGDALVFHVHRCPAIHHMKENGYDIAPNFCEHTRIVNEAICNQAGYRSSVEYDQDAGQCVQRFWKDQR